MGRGNAVACCCSVFLPRQCLLKAGCIRLVHNGSKVGPTPPQGSGLLSAAATGSLIERWQLGCQGLLPGPRLRGGSGTWWGEGGCRTHSGRLCLWVTANSGFHMMPKLPGLWVQIRNVKPCCGPHWFWLKCLGGEYSFLRVVSGSHLSNGQALAQSGQATGSLDRTKQDVGLHTTQVFCPPGPHPSSQKCSDHEPSAGGGAVGRGLRSSPQRSRAHHQQAAGWLFWPCPCVSVSRHRVYRAGVNRTGPGARAPLLGGAAGPWGLTAWRGLEEGKLN